MPCWYLTLCFDLGSIEPLVKFSYSTFTGQCLKLQFLSLCVLFKLNQYMLHNMFLWSKHFFFYLTSKGSVQLLICKVWVLLKSCQLLMCFHEGFVVLVKCSWCTFSVQVSFPTLVLAEVMVIDVWHCVFMKAVLLPLITFSWCTLSDKC